MIMKPLRRLSELAFSQQLMIKCITVILFLGMAGTVQSQVIQTGNYTWKYARIGGGGYVTGTYFHPTIPGILYLKSDVSGPWRWDNTTQQWIDLTTTFTPDFGVLMGGVDAFAIDPNSSTTIYATFGGAYQNENTGLYKSTDSGATWTKLLNIFVAANNRAGIQGGSRHTNLGMQVDPNNSNVIYFGTRRDGLYRSLDAGATWNVVPSVPVVPNPGVETVAVDPGQTLSGRSAKVYAGVEGEGVWMSTDGGDTFDSIPGSPDYPFLMRVDQLGALYVSSSQGLWRYENNTWTQLRTSNRPGFDIDPNNPNNILQMGGSSVFRSTDRGATFETISKGDNTIVEAEGPYKKKSRFFAGGTLIEFDPHNPGTVIANDAYMAWRTSDVWAATTVWEPMFSFENTIPFTLQSPPIALNHDMAPLYSGSADVIGHRHLKDLDQVPDELASRDNGNQITDITYMESDPAYMYASRPQQFGSWDPRVLRTTNGKNFVRTATRPFPSGTRVGGANVSVSSTNPLNVIYVPGNGLGAKYSKDGGDSWTFVNGLPNGILTRTGYYEWDHPEAADPVDGNVFYIYHSGSSRFYRSTDGGENWAPTPASLPGRGGSADFSTVYVKPLPGEEGVIWITLGTNGLWASNDGGDSFSEVGNFEKAWMFDWGKNEPGSPNPTGYCFGRISGIWGMYRTHDLGATWEKLPADWIPQWPRAMSADKQVYGRVYIESMGKGVMYGAITNWDTTPPSAPQNVLATGQQESVALDWDDNAEGDILGYNVYRADSPSGRYVKLNDTILTTSQYTDNGALIGDNSYYRIVALDANENESESSDEVTAVATAGPNTPTIILEVLDSTGSEIGPDTLLFRLSASPALTTDLAVNLEFSGLAVNGVDFAAIDESITLPPPGMKELIIIPAQDSAPAEGDETFTIQLKAGGGYLVGASSAGSATIEDNPDPGAPSELTATTESVSTIELSWADNADEETGYEIEAKEAGGAYGLVGTVGQNEKSFVARQLKSNTTYTFRVRASGDNGNSSYSNEASATTLPAATGYDPGFIWNRSVDWGGQSGNPDTDQLGGEAWFYTFIEDVDAGKDSPTPWWENPQLPLVWGGNRNQWDQGNVFAHPAVRQNSLRERRDGFDARYLGIPVVTWSNPTGKELALEISGNLLVEFGTEGGRTRAVDVVILKQDAGGFSKLYENRWSGDPGDAFADTVSLEVDVLAGENIVITLHQTAKALRNLAVLTDDLEFKIGGSIDNQPPVVSITAPGNNTLVLPGSNVTIEASASDPDGTVTKVAFYADTTLLGEDTTSPYAFTWANVPRGAYQLSAIATDNLSVSTTSPPVTLNVQEMPTDTLYSFSPIADAHVRKGIGADNNYGLAQVLQVRKHFNNYTYETYLKFDPGLIAGAIDKATLKLKVKRKDGDRQHVVRYVSSDSWEESVITWNNKPGVGTALDTVNVPAVGEWIEFDVTSQVVDEIANDGVISLRLETAGSSNQGPVIEYFSKEAGNADAPVLEILLQTPNGPILPAAPQNLMADISSSKEVVLSWIGAMDTTVNYVLERKVGAGNYTVLDTTDITFHPDADLVSGAGHTYRAFAFNEDGRSGYSEEVSILAPYLWVEYKTGTPVNVSDNHLRPQFKLVNQGTEAIPYAEITVRYWFTSEDHAPLNFTCDYAALGTNNVLGNFAKTGSPLEGANYYVDFTFTPTAGSLQPGADSGPIEIRLHKSDWTDFEEAGDHSYAEASSFVENASITVYRNGELAWGNEPAAVPGLVAFEVEYRTGDFGNPSDNHLKPHFNLRNTGNVDVDYQDLTLRYLFTPEGEAPFNYWVDHAAMGSAKIAASFGRLDPAETGAEAYMDVTFTDAGMLHAYSQSGDVQVRVAKSDWSNFDEEDDFSYANVNESTANPQILLYHQGNLVWGTLPGSTGTNLRAGSQAQDGGQAITTSLRFFPNPVSDLLTIYLEESENIQAVAIHLIDMQGRAAKQLDVTGNRAEYELDVSDVRDGLYFLVLDTGKERFTTKIQVAR